MISSTEIQETTQTTTQHSTTPTPCASLAERNNGGRSALLVAAGAGRFEMVKWLLAQPGVSIAEKDKEGCTVLLLAAFSGHIEMVKWLLAQTGVSLFDQDIHGRTALSQAILNGQVEMVKWLVTELDLSLAHQKDKYGFTPLLLAAHNGHIEVVKWLLTQRGVSLTDEDFNGRSALLQAAHYGRFELAKWLVTQLGVSLMQKDKHGYTPLLLAAHNGHIEMVKWLLTQPEVSLADKNTNNSTALDIARNRNFPEVVAVLEEKAAQQSEVSLAPTSVPVSNQNIKDEKLSDIDTVSISSDARVKQETEMQQKINRLKTSRKILKKENLKLRNKLEERNNQQQVLDQMLFDACQEKNLTKMKRVLKLGANLEAKNSEGLTPLFYSLLNDWTDVARDLLIRKASLDAVNQEGQTILHVACKQGDLQKVKFILPFISKCDREASLLLSAHAIESTVEIKQLIANAILFQAIKQGNKDLVELILDRGANKQSREDLSTPEGLFTPLHNACYHNQFEIVKLLLERGCSTAAKDQYGRAPVESTSKQEIRDLISKHEDNKATLIQKYFRGHLVRKKQFPKMMEAYKSELQQQSGKAVAELCAKGAFEQVSSFGRAMQENHFHQAAQIIGIRQREICTRSGIKVKY